MKASHALALGGLALAFLHCSDGATNGSLDLLEDPGNQAPGSDSGTSDKGTDASPTSDAGAADGALLTDAGTKADTSPPADLGVFTNAGTFTATLGPNAPSKGAHGGKTPEGLACLTSGCHSGNNPDGPRFVFGGTVYKGVGSTTPAASVEVRVIDKGGVATSVYTDAKGNFYKKGSDLVGPATTGARDATIVQKMVATITSGDCNSCHKTGGTAVPIHVP